MRQLFLIVSICIISIIGGIAQPVLTWEKTTHNFGSFKEESGPQTAVFTFTNTGNQPLMLINVNASCGCTATEHTKETIQPGAKGFVNVTYNPANRPNFFTKTVTVTSNAEKPTTTLTIEGNVIQREKTIIDLYPREFGSLRLKSSAISFSRIYNTKTAIDSLEVINVSPDAINITFEEVPAHVKVIANPTKLEGHKNLNNGMGQKGYIIVSYDASKKDDWGIITEKFNVIVNGEKNNQYRIAINATIEEDFSHLSAEELANSPSIQFIESEYDFGTMKQGEKAVKNYSFTNNGKSDLIIRKIRTTCGCTATNPEKMVIKPGETSHITVTFNSSGKKGYQEKTITVITNDPKQSSVSLKIKGNIDSSTLD